MFFAYFLLFVCVGRDLAIENHNFSSKSDNLKIFNKKLCLCKKIINLLPLQNFCILFLVSRLDEMMS
jgi:hypothetical protein